MEYCAKKNIIITAYSAFGNNTVGTPLLITHPDVKATAERLSAAQGKTITPAHVLLAWAQVGGHTVIPKSVTASRIRENFQECELDDEAVKTINKIGEQAHRFNVPFTCMSLLIHGPKLQCTNSAFLQTPRAGTSTFSTTRRSRVLLPRLLFKSRKHSDNNRRNDTIK